jgi:hypothetical protein
MPSCGRPPEELRIFFGHQSVGADLLKGVLELRLEQPLRIVQTRSPSSAEPLLAHDLVGRNREPLRKIADFAAGLASGIGAWADIALLKLCYVDVSTTEDARLVFDAYSAAIAELSTRFPRLALGHVTMPLRCLDTGLLAVARRVVHGSDPEGGRNAARHSYNELLRSRYRERVFDLARIESEDSKGRAVGRRTRGDFVPGLAREYSTDGGHLNANGRERVAAEFVDYLARMSSLL